MGRERQVQSDRPLIDPLSTIHSILRPSLWSPNPRSNAHRHMGTEERIISSKRERLLSLCLSLSPEAAPRKKNHPWQATLENESVLLFAACVAGWLMRWIVLLALVIGYLALIFVSACAGSRSSRARRSARNLEARKVRMRRPPSPPPYGLSPLAEPAQVCPPAAAGVPGCETGDCAGGPTPGVCGDTRLYAHFKPLARACPATSAAMCRSRRSPARPRSSARAASSSNVTSRWPGEGEAGCEGGRCCCC